MNITHRSRYQYGAPVVASFNEARITPHASERQTVLRSSVTVDPSVPLLHYSDYWHTVVVAFDIAQSHSELTITGSADVETFLSRERDTWANWNRLKDPLIVDRLVEFLEPTLYTESDDELDAVAQALVQELSPRDAFYAVTEWVRDVMTYERGTTKVSTSALEAWRQGSGVCQDFAHLTIAMLRSLGIPARYVSGYLHPDNEAIVGETAQGASHAWVQAWLGSWIGHDPTNGSPINERHVVVARGRDYADVTPFRGVYQGGGGGRLDVDVELTRLS